jgi:hypothetical protein
LAIFERDFDTLLPSEDDVRLLFLPFLRLLAYFDYLA